MLSKLKSLADADVRATLLARIDAWWEGRDYIPEGGELEEEEPPPPIKPLEDDKKLSKAPPRIAALETIWGRGRYGPGSGDIDQALVEALGRQRGRIGKIGLLGADIISAEAAVQAYGEALILADWRQECASRSREIADNSKVLDCDLDRVKVFEDGSLKALLTLEAMTFVDHKPGLAARAYRALRDGGRWAMFDFVAADGFEPVASFASAWAEPQILTEEAYRGHLETSGFRNIAYQDVTSLVLDAARGAFSRLGAALEDAVAEGAEGRDGALMLQELSWEAASWRARVKALEKGGLRAVIWSVDKPGADMLAREADGFVDAVDTETAPAEDLLEEAEPDELEQLVEGAGEIEDVKADESWDAVTADGTDAPAEEAGEEDEDEDNPLDQDSIDSLFD